MAALCDMQQHDMTVEPCHAIDTVNALPSKHNYSDSGDPDPHHFRANVIYKFPLRLNDNISVLFSSTVFLDPDQTLIHMHQTSIVEKY